MTRESVVAVVTGASRGAGRGIAIALGAAGCTVYVTGRSERAGDHALSGTIHETAAAVTAAGGRGIAVRCDHADDAQIAALMARVEDEHGGSDILVNNAAAIAAETTRPGGFWEKPLHLADVVDVGIRSGYVASWHAAPAMVRRGRGLIVFTSASGAAHYSMGPAYGAHKAAMDKMAFDMAEDFRHVGSPVAALSIWMGALATERLEAIIAADPAKYAYLAGQIEHPEFTGRLIWALWSDPALAELSGTTQIGAELAHRYGVVDIDGRRPVSPCVAQGITPRQPYPLVIR